MKQNKEGWGRGNVSGLTRQQGRDGGREKGRRGNTWIFERRLFQAKEKSWHVQGTVKSRQGWSEGGERGGRGGGVEGLGRPQSAW